MITVVTICLNAEKIIEKTMLTVLAQRDVEIEYIIKDGDSTDDTNRVIDNIISNNCKNNIHYNHCILKDTGIYDAMNQAIERAHGDWIIFMNAGDYFYNSNVVNDVMKCIDNKADILYGNTIYAIGNGYYFPQVHDVSTINSHFNLGHQSCFIRTEVMKQFMFDSSYKIAGDYEQLLRLCKNDKQFKYVNMFVSICNREGISCQKSMLQFEEVQRVQNGGKITKNKKYQANYFLWMLKGKIAKMFPRWEKYRYCKNNMKRLGDSISGENNISRESCED